MINRVQAHKSHITWISGGLIIMAFIFKLGFNHIAVSQILLLIASLIGLAPIAMQAWSALKVRVISIDLLVTIAVIGAFAIQNYEESAIVTFLFLFGHFLEQKTLKKTRSAIQELLALAPDTAWKWTGHQYEQVSIDQVDVHDKILVKTGANIPVDGVVLSGQAHVNEASITGESAMIKKTTMIRSMLEPSLKMEV